MPISLITDEINTFISENFSDRISTLKVDMLHVINDLKTAELSNAYVSIDIIDKIMNEFERLYSITKELYWDLQNAIIEYNISSELINGDIETLKSICTKLENIYLNNKEKPIKVNPIYCNNM